jgi:alkylation response protein AidB-like acyl-CoA dehydrogenase
MPGGADWLLKPGEPGSVFTPERLSEEHRLIAQTVTDFVNQEVLPQLDRLEQKDWSLARQLLRRAGDLGLLGVDVAEAYGGLQLDKATSLVVSESMSMGASFSATFGAHANLVVLPLSLFGTEGQKRKYLPGLISGETVGGYCLSESSSGSDALGAKTRAVKQADGSYVLNGEKMWITNGGFADVFIVFAKVIDPAGEHFSAFIVERAFSGVSSGKEEHKMGLHGSSTTPVLLQEVRVPAENLLGEVGKGHKIAFNVLNFARYKLGAACAGAARAAIGEAARYAADRRQFGQPIASFGAIKHKLGEMVARTFAIESLVYRTAGLIDRRIAAIPHDPADQSAALESFEEYAIEASIAKVAGSENLNFVLDENIQIHGGNGFVRDYPAERHYRDSRVNRIFEGTNEINRLLIPGMLARRAVKGTSALIPAAKALQDELLGPPSMPGDDDSLLAEETRAVESLKKAAILIFGLALQTYGQKLSDQQEVLMFLADICMDVYGAESAVLRAKATSGLGTPGAPAPQATASISGTSSAPEGAGRSRASLQVDAARVVVNDAVTRVEASSRQALAAMTQGDTLRTTLAGARRLFKWTPIDTVTLRRRLADETVARKGYPL